MHIHQKLFKACDAGKVAEAKGLIAEGAPVDWQNEYGQTSLDMASKFGYTEIVMLLLETKCDTNVTNKDGDAPLIRAARNNNMTTARELAWSLCDLKIRNKKGKTAAEVAKERGHDALAEYLASQAPREQVRLASRRAYFALGSEHFSSETDVRSGTWHVVAFDGVGIAIDPLGIFSL